MEPKSHQESQVFFSSWAYRAMVLHISWQTGGKQVAGGDCTFIYSLLCHALHKLKAANR